MMLWLSIVLTMEALNAVRPQESIGQRTQDETMLKAQHHATNTSTGAIDLNCMIIMMWDHGSSSTTGKLKKWKDDKFEDLETVQFLHALGSQYVNHPDPDGVTKSRSNFPNLADILWPNWMSISYREVEPSSNVWEPATGKANQQYGQTLDPTSARVTSNAVTGPEDEKVEKVNTTIRKKQTKRTTNVCKWMIELVKKIKNGYKECWVGDFKMWDIHAATAGVRKVDKQLIKNVSSSIDKCFDDVFLNKHVHYLKLKVLSGAEEAFLEWMALNYKKNKIKLKSTTSTDETYTNFELRRTQQTLCFASSGGSSTQLVAIDPNEQITTESLTLPIKGDYIPISDADPNGNGYIKTQYGYFLSMIGNGQNDFKDAMKKEDTENTCMRDKFVAHGDPKTKFTQCKTFTKKVLDDPLQKVPEIVKNILQKLKGSITKWDQSKLEPLTKILGSKREIWLGGNMKYTYENWVTMNKELNVNIENSEIFAYKEICEMTPEQLKKQKGKEGFIANVCANLIYKHELLKIYLGGAKPKKEIKIAYTEWMDIYPLVAVLQKAEWYKKKVTN